MDLFSQCSAGLECQDMVPIQGIEKQSEYCDAITPFAPRPANLLAMDFWSFGSNVSFLSMTQHRKMSSALKAVPKRFLMSSVRPSRSQRRLLLNHRIAKRPHRNSQVLKVSNQQTPRVTVACPDEHVAHIELQGESVNGSDDMDTEIASEDSIISTDLSGRVIIDTVDEDALPVDHHRRSYDVVDFLHRWRFSSSWDEKDPPQHPDVLKMSETRLSLDQVRQQDVELEYRSHDMQGIDWSSMQTDRQNASAARAAFHPSRIAAQARQLNYRCAQDLIDAQSERHYRFASFHPRRSRISHFQLRHLVGASNRAAIFCANSGDVSKCSLASPSANETVMKVAQPSTFQITCLDVSQGSDFPEYGSDKVLVAGGFRGEYAMLNLAREHDAPSEGHVAPADNGLVTHVHSLAHRRSGIPQAVFCTNNQQVRTLDTRTLQWTHTFTYRNAVNCSTTSPDSRLRVLASDDNDISIADAEKGDVQVTLRGHTDYAFACAWSPDGRYVATGAQDTTVRVWDARNWSRSVSCLPSVQTCPRSLHFTADAKLIVAESEDVVSIHDAPLFAPQHRQDIRFFGAIAGVAVLDAGAEIVIANADNSVGGLLAFQRTRMGYTPSQMRRAPVAVTGGLMDDMVV